MADAHELGRTRHGRYYCRRCADKARVVQALERYAQGYYAGMLCEACWAADGRQHCLPFDSMDAGERMHPEDA